MEKIYSEKHTIEIDECDSNFNLKLNEILKISERISMHHASKYGLGKKGTFDKGLGWIVSRIEVKINKLPKYEQTITVKTIAYLPMKLIYPRKIFFYDEKNNLLLSLTMLWHLLNYKTRTLIEIKSNENYFSKEEFTIEDFPTSIKTKELKFKTFYSKKINSFDLDYNQHLNNLHYVEFALSNDSNDLFNNKKISNFNLQFIREVKENEEICFSKFEEINKVIYLGKIKNEDSFKMVLKFYE